jgi:hypothetical protein
MSRTPPGMTSSTLLFGARPYILPAGRRFDAFWAPLKIWSRTGTLGVSNVTPLTVKRPRVEF